MPNKPHLYFSNPVEGIVKYRQRTRYSEVEVDTSPKNYNPLKEDYQNSINNFFSDKRIRDERRNQQLNVPAHIDFIDIEFFDYFDTASFENQYISDFGLSVVRYTNFNTKVLFAITNQDGFNNLIAEIRKFIATVDHTGTVNYNANIKYIKGFEFLSTKKIIQYERLNQLATLSLIDNPDLYISIIRPLTQSLITYLQNKNVDFNINLTNNTIDIIGGTIEVIEEIANNFDIIQAINSHLAGIIRPSPFNLPERTFGFTINNAADDLPIIGIIDTGISNQTPLAPLLVNRSNADFDITSSGAFSDETNHGTGVAAIAALGKELYPNHIGNFKANAKLLSIKVMNSGSSFVLTSGSIIEQIRKAHSELQVKIFVLTITYIDFKKYNSSISDYSYALDLLAHELDILIFISVGNNSALQPGTVYPKHFLEENANLNIPSESMNNFSVGAIADNLEGNNLLGITPDKSFPAIYTRKYHLDLENGSLKKTQKNKHLFKPDTINCGGDYDSSFNSSQTGMKYLSSEVGQFFDRNAGTSFSAPLTANLSAKIIKQYPQLNMQTVKALIINSAELPSIGKAFHGVPASTQRHLFGNGIPNENSCLFSSENEVTFVIEDTIAPESIKSFPLNLPQYLSELDTEKNLLEINATFCFKFRPVHNNQLAYCPLHITFGMAKNLVLEQYVTRKVNDKDKDIDIGINGNTTEAAMINSWAQDYYFKAKLLSNTQKIAFRVKKTSLVDESNIFKIAIHSKYHKLLNVAQKDEYNSPNPFSLIINIKELPISGVNTGRLYSEITLINNLTAIADLDADLEV